MKDDKDTQPAEAAPAKRRLPYEAPAVISDEVFETLALSCARVRIACPPGNPNRS